MISARRVIAADAYFKCVNANGGINGRPVKYLMADDQWKPNMAARSPPSWSRTTRSSP